MHRGSGGDVTHGNDDEAGFPFEEIFEISIAANLSETAIDIAVPLESDYTSVAERTLKTKPIRRSTMNKSGFSYMKLSAFVAVLATTLIGLNGLLSITTIAQEAKETVEKVTAPDREIDLRAKLKDKKFEDGRRVTIETLASGEKLVAEVKDGKFLNWFLVATDGTEVQGVVKRKDGTKTKATCTQTVTTTTTTTNWRGKVKTVTSSSTIVQIPCPGDNPFDTFRT